MTEAVSARPRWVDWMPALALALSVAGVIKTGGSYVSQVGEQERRIVALESLVDRRDEQLRTIDLRLTRIEAKLEMMVPRDAGK